MHGPSISTSYHRIHSSPHHILLPNQLPFPVPHFLPHPSDMSGLSGPSHLWQLFEAALVDYQQQTGVDLAKHTLADRLQDCNSVEDVATVLSKQAKDFKQFREKNKVLKPLKEVLTVLHLVSSAPSIAKHVGLVRPKALTDVQCLRPSSYSLSGP